MYFWREHPNFVRVSIVMLVLLTFYSATQLLGYFGVLAPNMVEAVSTGFGVAFLFVSLAVIALAVGVVMKFIRARRSAP